MLGTERLLRLHGLVRSETAQQLVRPQRIVLSDEQVDVVGAVGEPVKPEHGRAPKPPVDGIPVQHVRDPEQRFFVHAIAPPPQLDRLKNSRSCAI
ncbi:hypothetical protein [Paenibacillus ehimensis]|uniref:hypothetical protein n=1 Tax=Paenibacillus ehimensis TaxID=79264 RepID=UPI003D278E1E